MPAFSGYAKTGYAKQGYYRTPGAPPPDISIVFPVPAVGTFVSASPTVAQVVAPVGPKGPYGVVVAVILTTHAGSRIFSEVAVDPVYTTPPHIGRHVTLLSLSGITLANQGSGSTLGTRVSSMELPSFSFTVDNGDGMISQMMATEILLGMSVSIYLDYGGGTHVFRGRAEVQSVEIRRKTATFNVGA